MLNVFTVNYVFVTGVLHDQNITVLHLVNGFFQLCPTGYRHKGYRLVEQVGQLFSDWPHRQAGLVFFLLDPAQVGEENCLPLVVQDVLDRWQSCHDPVVIPNDPVFNRHVEVDPH